MAGQTSMRLQSGKQCALALKEAGTPVLTCLIFKKGRFRERYDVVYVAYARPFGEDGCIQNSSQFCTLPHVSASAMGTEKELSTHV